MDITTQEEVIDLKDRLEGIQEKMDKWQAEIMRRMATRPIPLHQYYGPTVRFGVVSDTHVGSLFENNELLHLAYRIFQKEKIAHVYHSGDLVDGEKMYRGQEYEIYAHGADRQIKAVAERFPRIPGITTHFILGNHDLSFWKHGGHNIGQRVQFLRPDMEYLGDEEADIVVGDKKKIILRLLHPHKGTSYALSYQIQKYVESLTGGEKPKVLLVGHYHKAEYLFYRNIHILQAGTIQAQTPFMRGRNVAAMQGFWIVEIHIDKRGSINRFKQEWFPYFGGKAA